MAGKLNARKVDSLREPGRYSDGGNLYLFITPNGGKRWTFLYRWQGGKREMGLGSAATGHVSLAEARSAAAEARALLRTGTDPITIMGKDARSRRDKRIPTFAEAAADYVNSHRASFRNEKHVAQWEMTLGDAYCKTIRSKPINEIDTEAVLKVLQPIWQTVPETASRLRGRIENVIDAAKALGTYQGENPARWRGHLKMLLPARQRLSRGHHAALAYDDLPAFMGELRQRQSTAALALELTILCATRSGETLGATWDEVDFAKKIWTIPATRMKAGKEHRIPLTRRALDFLTELHATRLDHNPHVFPGNSRGKPLSNMAMTKVLERMKRGDITVHGFRSTFRDWASEQTSFPAQVCEMALAHAIANKVEAAYRRGDLFEKRRKLMEVWESYCTATGNGKIVPLRKA